MNAVTIDEEEYRRLKKAAGEDIDQEHAKAKAHCAAHGHTWRSIGGANAGCCDTCNCSVPVFECLICNDSDYGENDEAKEIIRFCNQVCEAVVEIAGTNP